MLELPTLEEFATEELALLLELLLELLLISLELCDDSLELLELETSDELDSLELSCELDELGGGGGGGSSDDTEELTELATLEEVFVSPPPEPPPQALKVSAITLTVGSRYRFFIMMASFYITFY